MRYSRPKEIRIWWPFPLAALLWLAAIWAFGFLLTPPREKAESPPVQASFIELPSEKKADVPAAVPPQPVEARPRARARPRLGDARAKSTPRDRGTARKSAKARPAPAPAPESPKDLADYVKEAKERRTAGGIFEDEPAEPRNIDPEVGEDELRIANVQRNLREPGTSGIFTMTRMGARSAQFIFQAWRMDNSLPRRELVEVAAGPDGDIQRAVVRKMIELIRQYHKEDFHWESYRLNRVVTLSARLEDSRGLEDFLIREFF